MTAPATIPVANRTVERRRPRNMTGTRNLRISGSKNLRL
jgi:hypothetical protein